MVIENVCAKYYSYYHHHQHYYWNCSSSLQLRFFWYVHWTSGIITRGYTNIAFPASNGLPESYWILCWLLLTVSRIIVLTIARSDLAKVIFYTVLIDNGRFDAWLWEICTSALKPRHMDWISNQSLLEIKVELSSVLSSLQSNMNA